MIKEPTAQEQARAKARGEVAPAKVLVATNSVNRALKPAESELLRRAADLALTEAMEAGYQTLTFNEVQEFITRDGGPDSTIVFRYVWDFTAFKPEG